MVREEREDLPHEKTKNSYEKIILFRFRARFNYDAHDRIHACIARGLSKS